MNSTPVVGYNSATQTSPSMMNKKLLRNFLFLSLLLTSTISWAQIYSNVFTGTGACPTQGNTPTVSANATGAPLSRSTITCTTANNVFNSTTLNNTASVNLASYAEFSVTADPGYQLNLTDLSFFRQASNTAPDQLEVSYSTDGFATSTTWGAAPNTPISPGGVAAWDFADFSTPIGGTVTFRFYPFGTLQADGVGVASAAGTFRLDDVTLNGAVVLPIELINFSARVVDAKETVLAFSTATETNNAYFSIERSQEGSRFETIGKVTGAGTSMVKHEYTYTDERPLKGTNFYRLKQVDFDGQFSYSPVVSVTIGKIGGVRLSPQPVSDQLNVAFEQPTAEAAVWQIYDFSGRLLQSGSVEAESTNFEISTIALTEGAYVLRLVNGQQIITQQFQKN